MDYLMLAVGLLFLIISLLSVYKPNWVWGRPRANLNENQRARLMRRRKIGTVVYFAIGAALRVLSLR